MMAKQEVYLIDTTLRDGEQTPGLAFSNRNKFRIAQSLDQLGVQEVEAGTPAIGKSEQEVISEIAHAGFSFKTSCWCRAKRSDILAASKLGTQAINISLPVSDIQINTLGKSRKWILSEVPAIIFFAKQYFPHVTLGAQDASRADRDFLESFIRLAFHAGVDRVRIADTVGLLDPMETYDLLRDIAQTFPDKEFEYHGHNDLGFATANSIMAVRAGIKCVSTTINGLGERAGNAATEEVIAYLHYKLKDRRFNTKGIYRLCRMVERISGIQIPGSKAITGNNAFRHESGIHTASILKNPESYQILDPADFGAGKLKFVNGKHSGKHALQEFFKSRKISVNDEVTSLILEKIKQDMISSTKPLTDKMIMRYVIDLQELCPDKDF